MTIQIEKENDENLYISFNYDVERVRRIKSIKGSYWDSKKKVWGIPYNKKTLLEFLYLFSDEEIVAQDALDCFMLMK
ncbi:hypothetical protein [Marinisporobacter balticus]|uniref:Uncharacterized protein n=1 Tax=Marinisporobacter balticus TaxID=2018667 RepID=A0A4R2LJ96_9FIRM|nr:hypothetical protein [Marinisporobacter balticus]TCO79435.1 hypothetical protein EV214_102154 [Marinisporobacter balticus]